MGYGMGVSLGIVVWFVIFTIVGILKLNRIIRLLEIKSHITKVEA